MLHTKYTSIRKLQREYKAIIRDMTQQEVVVVIANNQPQFALISMDMLEELQQKSTIDKFNKV